MTFTMIISLFILGSIGGTLSGMLGIGGGIIMAPLLLYVPPMIGLERLDMKVVAGLTIVQSLFSALSGVIVHKKFKHVHTELVFFMGMTIFIASLGGAVVSKYVESDVLLGLFACLALIAVVLMFLPKNEIDRDVSSDEVSFNKPLAIGIALFVGVIGGMVGQSGAFILIPMILHILKVPTRITIGSSLGIILCAASAGTAGKVLTGQIVYHYAAALVCGALTGAQLGGYLSNRIQAKALRYALAFVIAASAVKMWYEILA